MLSPFSGFFTSAVLLRTSVEIFLKKGSFTNLEN
jgi:hypothetical protein